MTSGSMSPYLGDMWKYGCPKSPDWVVTSTFGPRARNSAEDVARNLRQVWEGPCWEGMWPFVEPFLEPWDASEMPATASRWNVPSKYVRFDELHFPKKKKAGNQRGHRR